MAVTVVLLGALSAAMPVRPQPATREAAIVAAGIEAWRLAEEVRREAIRVAGLAQGVRAAHQDLAGRPLPRPGEADRQPFRCDGTDPGAWLRRIDEAFGRWAPGGDDGGAEDLARLLDDLAAEAAGCATGPPIRPLEAAQASALQVVDGLERLGRTAGWLGERAESLREALADGALADLTGARSPRLPPRVPGPDAGVVGHPPGLALPPPRPVYGFAAVSAGAARAADAVRLAGRRADALAWWRLAEATCRRDGCPAASVLAAERARAVEAVSASKVQAAAARRWLDDRLRALASPGPSAAEALRLVEAVARRSRASVEQATAPALAAADAWDAAGNGVLGGLREPLIAAWVAHRDRQQAMHGREPPVPPEVLAAVDRAFGAQPPAAVAGHAFLRLTRPGGEPGGFATYTYVLMGPAPEQDAVATRRRQRAVLQAIQRRAFESGEVPAEARARFNLFCVPSAETDATLGAPLAYDAAVGNQLAVRARTALLAQPVVLGRLVSSPGPFLVTLPSPLSASGAPAPMLVADLSQHPVDAIADVVGSYLRGMVSGFDREAVDWQPPWPQRVALWMVWMADVAGSVRTRELPALVATGR